MFMYLKGGRTSASTPKSHTYHGDISIQCRTFYGVQKYALKDEGAFGNKKSGITAGITVITNSNTSFLKLPYIWINIDALFFIYLFA